MCLRKDDGMCQMVFEKGYEVWEIKRIGGKFVQRGRGREMLHGIKGGRAC